MQIKIEIDVRPDELRRFIGLPDVAGLQDEFVQFLRQKLHQAGESFDAGAFVKSNLKLLSKSPLLGKLFTPVKDAVGMSDDSGTVSQAVSPGESVSAVTKRKRGSTSASLPSARKKRSPATGKSSRRKARQVAGKEG